MPFLDALVTPEHNETLATCIYRRPTHTEQYLHWNSHYHIGAKYSVINTLTYKAKAVSSTPELLSTAKQHIREVLTDCKYPACLWTYWNARISKNISPNTRNNNIKKSRNSNNKQEIHSHTEYTGPVQKQKRHMQ